MKLIMVRDFFQLSMGAMLTLGIQLSQQNQAMQERQKSAALLRLKGFLTLMCHAIALSGSFFLQWHSLGPLLLREKIFYSMAMANQRVRKKINFDLG